MVSGVRWSVRYKCSMVVDMKYGYTTHEPHFPASGLRLGGWVGSEQTKGWGWGQRMGYNAVR